MPPSSVVLGIRVTELDNGGDWVVQFVSSLSEHIKCNSYALEQIEMLGPMTEFWPTGCGWTWCGPLLSWSTNASMGDPSGFSPSSLIPASRGMLGVRDGKQGSHRKEGAGSLNGFFLEESHLWIQKTHFEFSRSHFCENIVMLDVGVAMFAIINYCQY